MRLSMSLNTEYVDDEQGMCQMFVDNFSSESIQIRTYTDPHEFLHEVETLDLDLIILDYRLPNMTGDELAKRLGTRIPKVLVSDDLTLDPTQDYMRIFSKPFDFDEVDILLNGLVAQKKNSL
jgi:DNA-binding response OmpR family regulator